LLVTVNNRLKYEIEIVHDLSCHPIFLCRFVNSVHDGQYCTCWSVLYKILHGQNCIILTSLHLMDNVYMLRCLLKSNLFYWGFGTCWLVFLECCDTFSYMFTYWYEVNHVRFIHGVCVCVCRTEASNGAAVHSGLLTCVHSVHVHATHRSHEWWRESPQPAGVCY